METITRNSFIKPGKFAEPAPADYRRTEFDIGNEVLIAKGVKVDAVFIGDSITHWWDVQTYFGGSGKVVVNRGIAGDNAAHVLRRFDADVIQLKPSAVVIKIGINHFWDLDAWKEEERRSPEAIIPEIVRDVRAMLAKAKSAGILPVLCSVLATNIVTSANDGQRNEAVKELNLVLAAAAAEEGAVYVDYHTALLSEDGKRLLDGMADDGLHPHVAGYDRMAEILRIALLPHGILL